MQDGAAPRGSVGALIARLVAADAALTPNATGAPSGSLRTPSGAPAVVSTLGEGSGVRRVDSEHGAPSILIEERDGEPVTILDVAKAGLTSLANALPGDDNTQNRLCGGQPGAGPCNGIGDPQ